MKKLIIHQPDFMPWLGFFHKLSLCNEFLVFDHVQISNGKSWSSRNKILLNGKPFWLTIPTIKSKNQRIRAARPPTPAPLLARPLQARFRVWTGLLVASTLAHTSSPRPQHAPLSTHQGVPLMLCNLICDQFERYSSGLCSSFSQRDFRIKPTHNRYNQPQSPTIAVQSPACLDPTLRRHGVMVRRDM